MPSRLALLVAILLLALVPLRQSEVHGCASVWRPGETVVVAEESALILWDAAQKIQHFIRWAAFETKAADFGFLVPTPTQPVLAEAPSSVFDTLEQWTAPKVIQRSEWSFAPMFCILGCATKAELKSARADVRVLDRQTVGGFDASVLEADDAEALRQWLAKNGYAARPELTSWLGPYLADKWKITAFKIAKDAKTGASLKTSPVRMTFRTERPFFPYREPEEPKDPANGYHGRRTLRVFFAGTERVQGVIGNTVWSANVAWSNPLPEGRRSELIETLGLEDQQVPRNVRLTVFEDPSSPRAGKEEVYFEASPEQSNVVRPDRHMVTASIWIPGDVLAVGLGIGLIVLVNRIARKRA